MGTGSERPASDPDSDIEAEAPASGRTSDDSVDDDLDAALDSFLDWASDEQLADGSWGSGIQGIRLPDVGPTSLEPGTLFGDFELVRSLGEGSMGLVYEARQRSVPGRTVAIKIMRTALPSPKLRERFRREVAVIGHLDHPHVVPVLAAGIDRGLPFYAMKLVEGLSGAELLEKLRARNAPPTLALLRDVMSDAARTSGKDESAPLSNWESSYARWIARSCQNVADALQHAHDQGIVHRDVKPGNIMFTTAGRSMLMDFGLAADESDVTLTRSGDFLGTMAYASPEQVSGETVDARSDVFSLGATLYELLSLRRAFPSTSRSELQHAITSQEPAPLEAEIPADLRTICMHALAKSPGRRYRSCAALANDLRDFLAGHPIQARPPGRIARAVRTLRAHPRITSATAVTLLLAGGLVVRDRWRAYACVRSARPELEACLNAAREADVLGAVLLEDFRSADVELRAAFRHAPGFAPARAALAQLHAAELRLRLAGWDDVYAPHEVRELEQEIALDGHEADYASLLEPTGWLEIESDPPGARVRLWREGDADALIEERAPRRFEGLAEGTYFAELEAPGRLTTRTHLLVRRAAVDADEAHPARYVTLRLPELAEARPGYRFVPGGWTFVQDEPVSYEYVEPFWIQEFEVTFAEWVAWMNAMERVGRAPWPLEGSSDDPQWRPRLGAEPPSWEVRRDDAGRWVCAPGVEPTWPVRGLKAPEMHSYAVTADLARGEVLDDTCPSLPTRAQLMRAGRGADARAYPWGNDLDADHCASYLARESWGHEPFPYPIGTYSADVSPFGVRDLAGSVREATRSPGGPLRGEIAVCFGSYRTTDARDLRLATVASENIEPAGDVGFRCVLNPWPAWCAPGTAGSRAFEDDFERADSEDVGHGWQETQGELFDQDYDPLSEERCFIEDGRLVIEGGVGNFSEVSTAWIPIATGDPGCVVTALVSVDCGARGSTRWVGLALRSHVRTTLTRNTVLSIDCSGTLRLETPSQRARAAGRCELGRTYGLRLEARPDGTRAWIWPEGEEPGEAPDLELPPEAQALRPRYLTLTSGCYVGTRLAVERLAFRAFEE